MIVSQQYSIFLKNGDCPLAGGTIESDFYENDLKIHFMKSEEILEDTEAISIFNKNYKLIIKTL